MPEEFPKMEISKAAVGLIVAAGVTAGAGGAYFARDDKPAAAAVIQADPSAGTSREAGVVAPTEGIGTGLDMVAAPRALPSPALRPSPRPLVSRSAGPAGPPDIAPDHAAAAPVDEERTAPPAAPEAPAVTDVEVARVIEPTGPELIELVVSADSVIGLQLDSAVTSERARVEDAVEAHVVRDVRVGDRNAIPAGSKVHGEVTLVDRGGRVKERARLGVRFTSIVLPNGTRLPIQTETVYREGDSQAASSSAKIGGGALGGAIIGGLLGGAKGAAIGGSVGAGAGTAAVMAGNRNQATLPAGAPLTIRIEQPIVITVER
jgi:hypothetical protein